MKISFYGAAREVTGSCYLVESGGGTKVLVDCGMFQGCNTCDVKNYTNLYFEAKEIEAVFVTHAHLDHTGRLPKLYKDGFRGKIFGTAPTLRLAELVLLDAVHIMEDDLKREQRAMLYSREDVEQTVKHFVTVDYSRDAMVGDLIGRPRDAGHIFGSAFWELEDEQGKRATFSGDVGNYGSKILRPTAQLSPTDALIVESTYGNRVHEDESTRETKLREVVKRTIDQKGVLVIPAFAIDRTQQILFELNHLVEKGLLPEVPIYLDSPMAIKATEVVKDYPQYYNKEARELAASGDDLFDFPGLKLTASRDESKLINDAPRPKVIIAGSGMMNGGRIQHHLVRYLSDPNSTVLIVGYQAQGTLGRDLYEGKKLVDVLQEKVHVKAQIMTIGAYSAHADQAKLVQWVEEAAEKPKRIIVTHGEEGAAVALATRFQQHFDIPSQAPHFGDTIEV
ncbi:MBL fold metallo-hydrolase [Patescibacteria group bacterium]|jgi:metallo-beta-lactamase family protein|nr:MBL fold metallo-hydrolase [Patescibacteria group bacterium]